MSAANPSRSQLQAVSDAARVRVDAKGASFAGRIFPMLLLGLFFVALLLSLMAGVAIYQGISREQASANSQRESLALIANVVRAGDASAGVAQGRGPEGPALVLRERAASGDYETRLYEYQGAIVQEYAPASNAYCPDKAAKVADSRTFGFTLDNGLLTVTCDQGSTEVALRSMQGGR